MSRPIDKVISNNLVGSYYGEQTEVAIVGSFDGTNLMLALAPCKELELSDDYTPLLYGDQTIRPHIHSKIHNRHETQDQSSRNFACDFFVDQRDGNLGQADNN